MREDEPVVVLGGGPAGSAAARLLASWGHRVVILTRAAHEERSLGESLPPTGVALLQRIGFPDLDAGGFLRSSGNTVRWATEARTEHFASDRFGYQVDRAAFDAFLLRDAVRAGAEVRVANATRVEPGSPNTITYESEGRQQTIQAEWMLDCTGRTGVVARNGWRHPEPGARTTAIVGVWQRDDGEWPTSNPTHTVVESNDDGWAWSVPVSARRRYVTLMVDPTRTPVASRERLQQDYLDQLARTKTLASLVAGARLHQPAFARDASPYSARTFAAPGALLVGDAGSFVDPLSSFGIKKALASAWLASVVLHSVITGPAIEVLALDLFNRREVAIYESLRRAAAGLARDASTTHATSFWESRAAAADDPDPLFDPNVAALREDVDVVRAFAALRASESPLRLRPGRGLQRVRKATVRGNRVVVEDHLVSLAFPEGVRYVRNVDLVHLTEIAPSHRDVPDLFEAYNRTAPPVPLPDFLGALTLLIGKGFVEPSDA